MAPSQLSTSARGRCVGKICESPQEELNGVRGRGKKIYANEQVIIGRDPEKCNYVVYDPTVSCKHLRIHTIIVDQDDASGVAPLVYAEDLSRNGTYWNNALMGKGRGGFLLSDDDVLQISSRIKLVFKQDVPEIVELVDDVQERETQQFHHKYVISDRKLGFGAFGVVKMAVERSSKTQLACKIVNLRRVTIKGRPKANAEERSTSVDKMDSSEQKQSIESWVERKKVAKIREDRLKLYRREAHILSQINHPNIIGLEKVYISDNTIYMFLELVTGGDLFSYLDSKDGILPEIETAIIVRQILIAVGHLHSNGIAHRDLKPENILMSSVSGGCRVILTDFGAARTFDCENRRMVTSVGTTEYQAPEVLTKKSGYTKAIDMWSVGCVTVVLLTGGSPFRVSSTGEYSQVLAQKCDLSELEQNEEWRAVSRRPKNFVKGLLVRDFDQRMTASQALSHSWFTHNVYCNEFDELYKRTIRGWRPRLPKQPLIEPLSGDHTNDTPEPEVERKSIKRPLTPIDPPYKPYPRKLSKILMPNQRTHPRRTFGKEVENAIAEYWSKSPRPPRLSASSSSAGRGSPSLNQGLNHREDVRSQVSPRPKYGRDRISIPNKGNDFEPLVSKHKENKHAGTSINNQQPTSVKDISENTNIANKPEITQQRAGHHSVLSPPANMFNGKVRSMRDASPGFSDQVNKGMHTPLAKETHASLLRKQPKAIKRAFSPEAWTASPITSNYSNASFSLEMKKSTIGVNVPTAAGSLAEHKDQSGIQELDWETENEGQSVESQNFPNQARGAGGTSMNGPVTTRLKSPSWSRGRNYSILNGGQTWKASHVTKMKKRRKSSIFDLDEDGDEDEFDGVILTGTS